MLKINNGQNNLSFSAKINKTPEVEGMARELKPKARQALEFVTGRAAFDERYSDFDTYVSQNVLKIALRNSAGSMQSTEIKDSVTKHGLNEWYEEAVRFLTIPGDGSGKGR